MSIRLKYITKGGVTVLESAFQRKTKEEIKRRFPGCVIKRNDPHDIQGFPDITVFYRCKYAHLEFKQRKNAKHQPNQDYYVDLFNKMGGFAAFIYPENKEDILIEMREYFNAG